MSNAARKVAPSVVIGELGSIVRADDERFVVRTDDSERSAVRAPSCMLEPEIGDSVLLAALPTGACYVLAVLERAADGPVTLKAGHGITIQVPEGKFAVAAQDGIELATGGDVDVAAGGFRVGATEGSLVFRRLSVLSTVVRAEIERAKVLASTLDSVVERITQRAKRIYRAVEVEHVRAERLDVHASKVVNVRAETALLSAEELVKIDGAQVRLG